MRTSELHLILNSKQKGFRTRCYQWPQNFSFSSPSKFCRKRCVWSYSSGFLVTIWTKINQKSPKTLFTVSKFVVQRLYLHFSIILRPWVSVWPRESKSFYSQALNWQSLSCRGRVQVEYFAALCSWCYITCAEGQVSRCKSDTAS